MVCSHAVNHPVHAALSIFALGLCFAPQGRTTGMAGSGRMGIREAVAPKVADHVARVWGIVQHRAADVPQLSEKPVGPDAEGGGACLPAFAYGKGICPVSHGAGGARASLTALPRHCPELIRFLRVPGGDWRTGFPRWRGIREAKTARTALRPLENAAPHDSRRRVGASGARVILAGQGVIRRLAGFARKSQEGQAGQEGTARAEWPGPLVLEGEAPTTASARGSSGWSCRPWGRPP